MGIPSLSITSNVTLGKMLIESAAMFEASAAELIGAEGQKIQRLVAATGTNRVSTSNLMFTNGQVRDLVCCLKDLENAILGKVAAGVSLVNHP